MALDACDRIASFTPFYPTFTQKCVDEEVKHKMETIRLQLTGDAHTLLKKLKEIIININEFERIAKFNKNVPLEHRIIMSLTLWKLLTLPSCELYNKIRISNCLVNVITSIRCHYTPKRWMNSSCRSQHTSPQELEPLKSLDWRTLLELISNQFDNTYKSTFEASNRRRMKFVNSAVKLVLRLRYFWDAKEVSEGLCEYIETSVNTASVDIYMKFRMLRVFSSSAVCFEFVQTGKLFEWWSLINGSTVIGWNGIFVSMLANAAKYGWAVGDAICIQIQHYFAFLIHLLLNETAIPARVQSKPTASSIPNEYLVLMGKPISAVRHLGKLFAYVAHPWSYHTNHMQSQKRMVATAIEGGDPHTLIEEGVEILTYIEAFVKAVFPYTNPSNNGKWSLPIGTFIHKFISTYYKRVTIERQGDAITATHCGMSVIGDKTVCVRLTKEYDVQVAALFYPLLAQSIYSKNPGVSHGYEECLSLICSLSPDELLELFVMKMIESLEAVSESHLVNTSLRLITSVLPLIVQYRPEMLPDILTLSIPGIDSADSIKTLIALTLHFRIFSYLPAVDYSDVEVNEKTIKEFLEKYKRLRSLCTASDVSYQMQTTDDGCEVNYPPLTSIWNYPSMDEFSISKNSKNNLMKLEAVYSNDVQFEELISRRKMATSVLPYFVEEWFDQILKFVASSQKTGESVGIAAMAELQVNNVLCYCCARMSACIDQALITRLAVKYIEWIFSNCYEDARKRAKSIAYHFFSCHFTIVSNLMIPKLYSNIVTETKGENGESSYEICTHTSEGHILWYIGCLIGIFARSGKEMLPYMQQLYNIVDACLKHESKKICKAGVNVVKMCIRNCIENYTIWAGCMSSTEWSDKKKRDQFILRWGLPWWIEGSSQKFDWHTASEEEYRETDRMVEAAFSYIWRFMKYVLSQEYIEEMKASSTDCDVKEVLCCVEAAPPNFMRDKKLSPFAAVARILSICRLLIKATARTYPDERENNDINFAVLSEFPNVLGPLLSKRISSILILLSDYCLGLDVTSHNTSVMYKEARLTVHGVEEPKIMKKLLKVIDQALTKRWASSMQPAGGNKDPQDMIDASFTAIANAFSLSEGSNTPHIIMDLTRDIWVDHVRLRLLGKMDYRTKHQTLAGHRLQLFLLELHLSMYQYANVRAYAQSILPDAVKCHQQSRRLMFEEVMKVWKNELDAPEKFGSESSSNHGESDAEKVESKGGKERIISHEESIHLSRMTGISYLLNNLRMMEMVWTQVEWIAELSEYLPKTFASKATEHTARVRWIGVTHALLMERLALTHDQHFDTHVVERVIRPLLLSLHTNQHHWHYHIVATSLLIVFNTPYESTCIGDYASWLLKSCEVALYHPLVNAVSMFGLTQLLKYVKKDPTKLPQHILDELHKPSTIEKLVNTLCSIHHEGLQSKAARYPETAQHLIMELLEYHRPWPFNRSSKRKTTVSLHNMMFCRTYFQLLYTTSNGRASFLIPLENTLKTLCALPPTEMEPRSAFIEIAAALIRVSRKWETTEWEALWRWLHPLVVNQLIKSDQDFLTYWRRGLTFALQKFDVQYINAYIPLFNIVLTTSNILKMDKLEEFMIADEDSATTTFENKKRLRLLHSMIEETTWEVLPLLDASILTVSHSFSHPYKQIREEAARIAVGILRMCARRECPPNVIERYGLVVRQIITTEGRSISSFVDVNSKMLQAGETAPRELCAARSIISYFGEALKGECGEGVLRDIIECLPLLLNCSKHEDKDLAAVASHTLLYYCVSNLHGKVGSQPGHAKLMSDNYEEYLRGAFDLLMELGKHDSWKIRKMVAEMFEVLGNFTRLLLHHSAIYSSIIETFVHFLKDANPVVTKVAKEALSSLFVTCDAKECTRFTGVFASLAGKSNDPQNFSAERYAGVLGLASLVHSAPYHIPPWLPDTITILAKYGNVKMPDKVRGLVVKSLQEFYRTHQDAWQQQHVKKFTEEQLDILETYKGRQSYFM